MITEPLAPSRPPLVRPQAGRLLGGVAAGVAAHLSLPLLWVRVGFVAAAFLGGAGALLYVWLWVLVPSAPTAPAGARAGVRSPVDAPAAVPSPVDAPVPSGQASPGTTAAMPSPVRGGRQPLPRGDLLVGTFLLFAGLYLAAVRAGLPVRPGIVVPVLVVAAGAVLGLSQLDEVQRTRWAERAGVGRRSALLRLAGGATLVVVGVVLVVAQRVGPAELGSSLFAAAAVLAGAGFVFAPWGVRLWQDLDAERAATAREAERADIAAHLHDSVLQTLALIQRHSADAAEVARLARAQERDLRGWLYGGRPSDPATLAARVTATAAEVEDLHGVVVEVVMVGDARVDERLAVMVAALREAVVNAARHAGDAVQVYVEAGPDGVEAFVRDRGTGFDPQVVPADRLGIRESIVGRMERHGGSARVRSAPGEGTEVRLEMPNRPEVLA